MGLKRKPPAGNARRVTPTGGSSCGEMTSKTGSIVQYESWAEHVLILQLDRNPDVVDYGSQPETFEYLDSEGKLRKYTPDFIVWRKNGEVEIHEVTRSERRSRLDIQRREKAGREICQKRGWKYIVHTEKSLPQATEAVNLSMLFGYRPTAYVDPIVACAIPAKLNNGERAFLNPLVRQIMGETNLSTSDIFPTVFHMLWHGDLITDLNKLILVQGEIGRTVQVWIEPKGENNGTQKG